MNILGGGREPRNYNLEWDITPPEIFARASLLILSNKGCALTNTKTFPKTHKQNRKNPKYRKQEVKQQQQQKPHQRTQKTNPKPHSRDQNKSMIYSHYFIYGNSFLGDTTAVCLFSSFYKELLSLLHSICLLQT